MVQIITPEMIGWKPLTDISDIKHWDRVTQKAVDYNDFKKNWIETFYHFPTEPIFWLDACTEREVALDFQVYSEIFNTLVKEN